MKKLIAALALFSVASAAPAVAGNVGVTIRIGEPGFYGQLDIGSYYRPSVIYSQPVLVVNRHRNYAPIYLRVPAGHSRNWSRYCDRYDACARPVYFVRDDWYRNGYAPRYNREHARDRHHDRRDDRREVRYDHRDDRRGDRQRH